SRPEAAHLLLIGERAGVVIADGGSALVEGGPVGGRALQQELAHVVAELRERRQLLVACPGGDRGGVVANDRGCRLADGVDVLRELVAGGKGAERLRIGAVLEDL